jgi:NAD+ kinase
VSRPPIAILVHPSRDVREAMQCLRDWAAEHGVELVQIGGPEHVRKGRIEDAGLILAVGGDGTVLAALRAAAPRTVPVLGVACGSLGALTTVAAAELPEALDRFQAGEWRPYRIPALVVKPNAGEPAEAINDLVVVRDGGSQVIASVEIDGVLYGRFAGDGVIVATQLGSSAYSMAAGGPILVPDSGAWVVTPLAAHGGSLPPAVVGARARVRLLIEPGYAGARVEIDGQPSGMAAGGFDLTLRPDFATLVRVGEEEEEFLSGLRRRKILLDSPRVLARDARVEARARG